jgi:hypothetical protein
MRHRDGNGQRKNAMRIDSGIEKVRHDLMRSLDNMRADLNRVELLTAAMSAFARPVPDYEPRFQHIRHLAISAHEMD